MLLISVELVRKFSEVFQLSWVVQSMALTNIGAFEVVLVSIDKLCFYLAELSGLNIKNWVELSYLCTWPNDNNNASWRYLLSSSASIWLPHNLSWRKITDVPSSNTPKMRHYGNASMVSFACGPLLAPIHIQTSLLL